MKKIILSAAVLCSFLGSAFAQTSSSPYTGNYAIVIQDFITLTPSGVVGTIQTLTFSNPTQMSTGLPVNGTTFTVVASRSWKATHVATDFNRTSPSGNLAISNTAPANIMKIWVNNTNGGTVTPIATTAPGVSVTLAPQVIASNPTGGLSQGFTLNGAITPGFATNLSGTYTNTITVIATLD